ncbi:hypothetical protein [Cognatishimia activa]|uniref:hypothetical protein n=1 Tax=Cognatishimia activa TaxID=1715691 RepID=UPI00223121FF|nr:hypothetical protein [Cognatishimia activa]UZD89585.1 hypothetical protein M0D42_08215 [Cognatishimia activa]
MGHFKILSTSAICLCLAMPLSAMDAAEIKEAYNMAETLRKTASTEADLAKALDIQQGLYDQGNRKSLLRMAQLQVALGQGEDALKSFTAASDAGSGYARHLLAVHHARSDFGAVSQPDVGLATLKEMAAQQDGQRAQLALAELYQDGIGGSRADANAIFADLALAGDSRAAKIVLRSHEKRSTRVQGLDVVGVVSAMEANLEKGDGRAADVLARAYLRLDRYIPNAAKRHRDLVANHIDLLPESKQLAEIVSAEYDYLNHSASARKLTAQLEPATGEPFVKAALRLRGIEKTAFVYLLQKELAALDAYSGPATGKLTTRTIRSVFAYCRKNDIFETCKHGPVNYDSSLLIARAIGAEKAARLSQTASN